MITIPFRSVKLNTFFFLAFIHQGIAQNSPVNILNVNNGLPAGAINCGLMDRYGFIWLGTHAGLVRFDGKHVQRYVNCPQDPCSLRSYGISRMIEDPEGRIWMVGDKGIEVYFPEQNCFKFVDNPSLGDFYSWGVLKWVDSLDLVFISGIPFKLYKFHIDSFMDCTELHYSEFRKLKYWGYYGNPEKSPNQKTDSFNLLSTFTQFMGRSRVRPEKNGLWAYYKESGGLHRFTNGKQNPEFISFPKIADFDWTGAALNFIDLNDSLALASANNLGLFLFRKSTGTIKKIWDFRADPLLKRSLSIDPLFCDPGGRVWFNVLPYGLFVVDPEGPRFQTLKNNHPDNLLYNGLVRCTYSDPHGNLWIGFQDGTVQILDPTCQKEIARWNLNQHYSSHVKESVVKFSATPDSSVLVNGIILLKLDKKGTIKSQWVIGPGEYFSGYSIHIHQVPDFLIINCKGSKKPFAKVISRNETRICPELYYLLQICISFYGKGDYWIATDPTGNMQTYKFNSISCPLRHDTKKINFKIKGYNQFDQSDTIWIFGEGGICIYVPQLKQISYLNTLSWPDNHCYGMLKDKKGKYWVSTNQGLIKFDIKTGLWTHYTNRDGLLSNEFNTSCYTLMQDGAFCFGGPEGLNIFDPDAFEADTGAFRIYLRQIRINENRYINVHPYQDHWKAELQPDENSIEFMFSNTLQRFRNNINYQIYLQGEDKQLTNIGQRDFARYINLRPGMHHLKLYAETDTGKKSENQLDIEIRVLPRYYQTLWFQMLISILGTGLFGLIYKLRSAQKKRLTEIRNRISRDLHDDIGSTLGSISVYSEVAKEIMPEKKDEVLEKIGTASREMLENINDIVWSIKPENDKFAKLEERMKSYAALLLTPKGIRYEITVTDESSSDIFPSEMRRNVYLIFKEVLFNAVKYSECTEVNIELKWINGKIHMEISDNGIGFDSNHYIAINGNGIPGMQKRAREIGAELKIVSASGTGTRVILKQGHN